MYCIGAYLVVGSGPVYEGKRPEEWYASTSKLVSLQQSTNDDELNTTYFAICVEISGELCVKFKAMAKKGTVFRALTRWARLYFHIPM